MIQYNIVNPYLGCCIYKAESYGENLYGTLLSSDEIHSFITNFKINFNPVAKANKLLKLTINLLEKMKIDEAYDIFDRVSLLYKYAATKTKQQKCKDFFIEMSQYYGVLK